MRATSRSEYLNEGVRREGIHRKVLLGGLSRQILTPRVEFEHQVRAHKGKDMHERHHHTTQDAELRLFTKNTAKFTNRPTMVSARTSEAPSVDEAAEFCQHVWREHAPTGLCERAAR
jgi:hypothetical protein